MNESEEVSNAWRAARAGYLALWLAASALAALATLEFGAAMDGVGFAHLTSPTYVTFLLVQVIVGVIGFFAYRAYRGAIDYTVGFFSGVVLWFLVVWLGAYSLEWHYARVCDTTDAPNACYAAVWEHKTNCRPDRDEACFERLQRACVLGREQGCDLLLENDTWNDEVMCRKLAANCERAKRCGAHGFPRHCAEDSLPGIAAMTYSGVCDVHETYCERDEQ